MTKLPHAQSSDSSDHSSQGGSEGLRGSRIRPEGTAFVPCKRDPMRVNELEKSAIESMLADCELGLRNSSINFDKISVCDREYTGAGFITKIEPSVDMALINSGKAVSSGGRYLVNGRTYGVHNGTLFPISGKGLHQLNRPAFKALGVFNKFGNSPGAARILNNMGIHIRDRGTAIRVWGMLR